MRSFVWGRLTFLKLGSASAGFGVWKFFEASGRQILVFSVIEIARQIYAGILRNCGF